MQYWKNIAGGWTMPEGSLRRRCASSEIDSSDSYYLHSCRYSDVSAIEAASDPARLDDESPDGDLNSGKRAFISKLRTKQKADGISRLEASRPVRIRGKHV